MTRAVRVAVTLTLALAFVPAAVAQDQPRYDVPRGYRQVSTGDGVERVLQVDVGEAHDAVGAPRRFLRAYAQAADRGPMPRHLRGFRCAIRYWRNEDGDIYASRHRCTRRAVVIRFYGMV